MRIVGRPAAVLLVAVSLLAVVIVVAAVEGRAAARLVRVP